MEKNKYELQDEIGQGGNAVIFSAIDSYGEESAIKIQVEQKGVRNKRFDFEREVHERLNHAHLVKFISSGTVTATISVKRKKIKKDLIS